MNETKSFKRYPTIYMWINFITTGKYSTAENVLYTVLGAVKRIRIVATIVEKREIVENSSFNAVSNDQDDEDYSEDSYMSNNEDLRQRIEFDLDDGTGLMRATLWNVEFNEYSEFNEGRLIDITGLINFWKGYKGLSPEIINIVKDPNLKLLKDAELIQNIRKKGLKQIPEHIEEFGFDNIPEEIDIEDLFDDDELDLKERIFNIIEKNSLSNKGTKFQYLREKLKTSEEELRNCLRDLEMESRIYQSENNIYQTF